MISNAFAAEPSSSASLRRSLPRAIEAGERVSAPVVEVFRGSWRQLLIGTFVMVATYTLFYTVNTWTLSYGTAARPPHGTGLGFSYLDFLLLQLIAVLFLAATRSTRLWYAWLACFALPWLSISALLPLVLGVGWAWTATASLERIRQGR